MTSGRPIYPICLCNCLVTIYLKDLVCRYGHLSLMLLLLTCVLFWSLIELSSLLALLAINLCHIRRIMFCLLLDQITRAVQIWKSSKTKYNFILLPRESSFMDRGVSSDCLVYTFLQLWGKQMSWKPNSSHTVLVISWPQPLFSLRFYLGCFLEIEFIHLPWMACNLPCKPQLLRDPSVSAPKILIIGMTHYFLVLP